MKLESSSLVLFDITVWFIVGLIGAMVKDIYDIKRGAQPHIVISKIFVSTIISVLCTFAARKYVAEDIIPILNFILGLLGWEIFINICTIDGLLSFVQSIRRIFGEIMSVRNEVTNTTNTDFNNSNQQSNRVNRQTQQTERSVQSDGNGPPQ